MGSGTTGNRQYLPGGDDDDELVRTDSGWKAVQRMLGHAPAAMTLDTDGDLFDDDLTAVADALDHRAMQTDVAVLLPWSS